LCIRGRFILFFGIRSGEGAFTQLGIDHVDTGSVVFDHLQLAHNAFGAVASSSTCSSTNHWIKLLEA